MSTFDGRIKEYPTVAIDNFKDIERPEIFILSHTHTGMITICSFFNGNSEIEHFKLTHFKLTHFKSTRFKSTRFKSTHSKLTHFKTRSYKRIGKHKI